MPALTAPLEAARVLQAMMALQFMLRGEGKELACAKAGITVDIFNRWISQGTGVVESLQQSIVDVEKERLITLMRAESMIIDSFVARFAASDGAAIDDNTALSFLKLVMQSRKELETKHGVNSRQDTAEEYAMQGPKLRIEESKMGVAHDMSRSTVNIKPMPDGSVDLTVQRQSAIIDIYPELAAGTEEEST